jgi:hypothetical protein
MIPLSMRKWIKIKPAFTRIIDVSEWKRKYVTAFCHLRNAVRTLKRSRIKSIEPV